MVNKECIAMLLAGGQGSRLGVLTKNVAKPAVPFGGKYRIIDFTLSNCINSGIDTVGVLTQYQPLVLNSYIGNGQPWDLDRMHGGVALLPPYTTSAKEEWYKGTANAIYQNMHFINHHEPDYVIILSGDHIYKMDYSKMLKYHKKMHSDATIAVIEVPIAQANRFGIMNTREDGSIYEFEEKPKLPKNNMASMGVYIFNWNVLKQYLIEDEADPKSSNDFGKNIIPKMLDGGMRLFAYPFSDYWKDVGTIMSLWEANMDLLANPPSFNLYDPSWRIYSRNPVQPPHYLAPEAYVKRSMITEGTKIYGRVEDSVIFHSVIVGKNSVVKSSIIMPGVTIGENVTIKHSIIGENAIIEDDCVIGEDQCYPNDSSTLTQGIAVVGDNVRVASGTVISGIEYA